ncbi:S9 family peptidase [Microbacterium sp. RU33B]|uniref:S9 family peptidase n=1 Tax=Microbacterium sp. RU33B TaxID=1907390 RepID=UPI00095D1859|nr:S9 family peptidase [Microbacterium sp. RU33B]SIT75733.1 Dipeptidyl aminopeptidase/acylaminoacyl peptidase [Microbacterium sp. RU33B]
MRAHDIEKLVSVGRPTISRDGSFAVYATSRPSVEANRNVGRLFRAELGSGETRPLTRGVADSSPRLSPDDTRVAFVRGDAKDKPQLWIVEAGGGEPVQVTDAPLGIRSFAWSPDGSRLAFTAPVPERGRYGTVEGLDASSEAPRRITGVRWHANGAGYIGDRPAHVFVVAAPDLSAEPSVAPAPAVRPEGDTPPRRAVVQHEAVQLTQGSASYAGVVFTADGAEILTVPDELEPAVRDLRTPLVAVRVDGGEVREVVSRDAGLSISEVAVAPDGVIALRASELRESPVDFVAASDALWILDAGGPRRLTDPDTSDLGEVGSHITAVGEDFLVQNRTRGRVELLRVSRTGAIESLLDGDVEVNGHAASDGGAIVASVAYPHSFGELVDLAGGVVTELGSALRDTGIAAPQEVEISARDGYPVHGWVAKPEGEGPFPVILQIHGGPYAQYGIHPFDETQVLVDAGYAVAYCNPRGSAGYGRAHGRSIRQAMGTLDYTDIIDFFDGVLAADASLDAERVGVMGGSYGGYMTAWVIAHDHRFAGAIVERGFLDPVSFQGTSDIGSFFGDEYVGLHADDMARQSPLEVVGQVTTPTLVLHSELDFRCPLEQATRYYSALKRQGTDAEMLIFPGEDHELTRGGQPRHRVERFAAVLDWWNRRLPV